MLCPHCDRLIHCPACGGDISARPDQPQEVDKLRADLEESIDARVRQAKTILRLEAEAARLREALAAVAAFPITDHVNMDAHNMRLLAESATTGAGRDV